MIVSAIVAATENHIIGSNNEIPWYLSEDFKFFKRTTLNHHIIMGRKTFESIGRPLPKRTNIILTTQPFYTASGCIIAHSLHEALTIADDNGETEAFIIGGGKIYDLAWQYLDKIYLTRVHTTLEGETYFPEIDEAKWTKEAIFSHKADEKNDYDFTVYLYVRREKENI